MLYSHLWFLSALAKTQEEEVIDRGKTATIKNSDGAILYSKDCYKQKRSWKANKTFCVKVT